MINEKDNALTAAIIGCAISVHREVGPGLLESHYESCLCIELRSQGLLIETQKSLPLFYKGVKIEGCYRLDLLVENKVILELKTVETLTSLHEAQLLSYLKMSRLPIGLLINFNVTVLKNGIKRLVNSP